MNLVDIAAQGHLDPRAGWLGVTALVTHALSTRDSGVPRDAALGWPAGTASAGPEWTVDRPVGPGGCVVLAGRSDDGTATWTAYAGDQVRTEPVPLAPAMDVWGGHLVRLRDGARAATVVDDSAAPGDGLLSLPPSVLAVVAAGAHALGVAGRFRDAFLRKAASSARGWAAVKTIDDPMVLSILLSAEALLDGAAALLTARTAKPAAGPAAQARLVVTGIAALDAARAATTQVMTLTGASALYDGNPMQETFAHLAALGAHPWFDRPARLLAERAALEPDLDRLFSDEPRKAS